MSKMDSIEKRKKEKETLQAIRERLLNPNTRNELLKELTQESDSASTSKENQKLKTSFGKTFTKAINGRRGLLERNDSQKGFSRPIMLGMITLICESLFLITSYLLFK